MTKSSIALIFSVCLLFISCGKDYDYEIGIGERIVIDLESLGSSGGYSWLWDKRDDVVDTVETEFLPYYENFEGSPGIERWVFVGAHKGSSVIRLHYKQPWETEVIESREYSVLVK